jgi:hypothetical protein
VYFALILEHTYSDEITCISDVILAAKREAVSQSMGSPLRGCNMTVISDVVMNVSEGNEAETWN